MRLDDDEFEDGERVYVAASLREARRVEEALTGHGIEYVVEVVELGRSTLFGSLRHGAAFSVRQAQAGYCRTMLSAIGRGVV
jgi:hypothetical protein